MTTSIYDVDEQGYIYDRQLTNRAREMRHELVEQWRIYPLAFRPTLRLRPEDERHITRHIHEGAWTIGMHEEDLPGFVPEELGR